MSIVSDERLCDVFDMIMLRLAKLEDQQNLLLKDKIYKDDSGPEGEISGLLHGHEGKIVKKQYDGEALCDTTSLMIVYQDNIDCNEDCTEESSILFYNKSPDTVIQRIKQTWKTNAKIDNYLMLLEKHNRNQDKNSYKHLRCKDVGIESDYTYLESHVLFETVRRMSPGIKALNKNLIVYEMYRENYEIYKMSEILDAVKTISWVCDVKSSRSVSVYKVRSKYTRVLSTIVVDNSEESILNEWNSVGGDTVWKRGRCLDELEDNFRYFSCLKVNKLKVQLLTGDDP